MIFYQTTTDAVTPDLLKHALFHGNTDIEILDLHFVDFPQVNTLESVFAIIDS